MREYFFPVGCALCETTLFDAHETWYGICEPCHRELLGDIAWMDRAVDREESSETAQGETRCELCGKPMVSGQGRCLSCREGPERSYDRLVTIFSYSGNYKKLFSEYKFNKNLAIGHFFAEIIIKAYRHLCQSEKGLPCFLIPVPPRPGKIKKTGWDQVEYLSWLVKAGWGEPHRQDSGLNPNTGLTVYHCLKRLESKVQKELSREDRLKNLKGRVTLCKEAPPVAIIMDDVITTGSTLDVCSAALKSCGTQKVFGICLMYD